MKKITIILILTLVSGIGYAQGVIAQTTPEAAKQKHKADSIAALTVDFPIHLTPAQEAKMKEFDEAPAKFQEAMKKLQDEKIKYVIGILDAQAKPVDQSKVKDFEHKPNELILKVIK